MGGRYFRNTKKGYSPTGRKKTVTYGTADAPAKDDAVHPTPTLRPNLSIETFTTYQVQQYSSTAVRTAVHLVRGEQLVGWFLRTLYETGNRRGKFHFFDDTRPSRGASEPPSTTHPPPTIHPRTYPVQQYSNPAVRTCRALHVTGEQQPMHWLQCSRAARDL